MPHISFEKKHERHPSGLEVLTETHTKFVTHLDDNDGFMAHNVNTRGGLAHMSNNRALPYAHDEHRAYDTREVRPAWADTHEPSRAIEYYDSDYNKWGGARSRGLPDDRSYASGYTNATRGRDYEPSDIASQMGDLRINGPPPSAYSGASARPPPPPSAYSRGPSRGPPSAVSHATTHRTNRSGAPPAQSVVSSAAPSHVTARSNGTRTPGTVISSGGRSGQPAYSTAPSSVDSWLETASVAPSESISNVGSRTGHDRRDRSGDRRGARPSGKDYAPALHNIAEDVGAQMLMAAGGRGDPRDLKALALARERRR